ncbi:hypothetical protein ED562_13935 [Microcystis aeruginosa FACHB-524]|nr:hypothetical protein ED562_13935 [Microcystis aeruginosa FACHB-524]
MYTGLGKLSIQSEKWRSGVVMFLNVKFCYEIQHFWLPIFIIFFIFSSFRFGIMRHNLTPIVDEIIKLVISLERV